MFLLLGVGLILSGTIVKAEDNNHDGAGARFVFNQSIQADREAFKAKIDADREAFKAEIEKKKADFKSATKAQKIAWRGKAQEMIDMRFQMAFTNLERIQGKVADLIAQLSSDGKDVTTAQDDLNLSKQNLSDAKAKLVVIKGLLPTDGSKITPEIFAQIKLTAREAKDLLKESRSNLVQAIHDVRALKGESNNDDNKDNNENEQ